MDLIFRFLFFFLFGGGAVGPTFADDNGGIVPITGEDNGGIVP